MLYLNQYKKKQGDDEGKHKKSWQGEGVVVMQNECKTTVILPDLALEPKLQRKDNPELDQSLIVQVQSVNIPELQAFFRVVN